MALVRAASKRLAFAPQAARIVRARYMSELATNDQQAVGAERQELEALKRGEIIFSRDPVRPSPTEGTKDNPILVPSIEHSRPVGVSYENSSYVDWFNLEAGKLFYVEKYNKYFKLFNPVK